jgi:hypothetical protein
MLRQQIFFLETSRKGMSTSISSSPSSVSSDDYIQTVLFTNSALSSDDESVDYSSSTTTTSIGIGIGIGTSTIFGGGCKPKLPRSTSWSYNLHL